MTAEHNGLPFAVERVLERLEGVRRSGSGFVARCPAHEDRVPSLSVAEGRRRPVVLWCHAGCSYEAIVAALGPSVSDLFVKPGEGAAFPAVHGQRVNTLLLRVARWRRMPWRSGCRSSSWRGSGCPTSRTWAGRRFGSPTWTWTVSRWRCGSGLGLSRVSVVTTAFAGERARSRCCTGCGGSGSRPRDNNCTPALRSALQSRLDSPRVRWEGA